MSQEVCPGVECCTPIFDSSIDVTTVCKELVTLLVTPEGSGEVYGGGRYLLGETAEINTVPNLDTAQEVGVDLVFLADESGTMSDTWEYLPQFFADLDTQLRLAGIGSGSIRNRYGMVSFSLNKVPDVTHYSTITIIGQGITYYMTPGNPWTEIDPADPAAGLAPLLDAIALISVGSYPSTAPGTPVACEDAYAAISTAIQDRTWRTGVPKVIIFFTDEDRNYSVYSNTGVFQLYPTYPDSDWEEQRVRILDEITAWGGTIHAGIAVTMSDGVDPVLGRHYDGTTYKANGSGGYTIGTNATYTGQLGTNTGNDANGNPYLPSGNKEDYYDLLMAIPNSTVWDYEQFRAGGLGQDSFTEAFVDALANDIVIQSSYAFDGWFDIHGELISATAAYSFEVDGHVTLIAHYHSIFV